MSALLTGSGLLRLFMWLCLAVLSICLCLARASQISMDDDNLYLAYAAQSQVERAAPLEQSLIDRIAAVPGCEESVFRFSFRKRYASNYAGYATVQRAVQNAAGSFLPAGPKSIVAGTLAAKALFLLLISSALGVAAVRGPSREIEAAVVCSFIALVALDLATRWVPTPGRVDITNLSRTITQQISSFFVISQAHSYFEVTPRNGALLLFVITLVLKWQGHWTAAVLTLLMIAPLHQTYGGLGLILFTVASAVSRPEVFATTLRRVVLVAAGLVYVVREHFLERLDVWVQVACAIGLVLAAVLFFRGVCSARFAAFRERYLGGWVEREIALDALTLIGLVTLVTLVSWVGDQVMQNALTRRYVWANLPIRSLSFVRFPAFVACFWLLLIRTQWLAKPSGRSVVAAACALCCLGLSWKYVSHLDTGVRKRLRSGIESNLRLPPERSILNPGAEENRIYAHLTMVAAGQMDPAAAETSILANRKISCSGR
jgi:hypothetical protein